MNTSREARNASLPMVSSQRVWLAHFQYIRMHFATTLQGSLVPEQVRNTREGVACDFFHRTVAVCLFDLPNRARDSRVG